MVLQCVLRLKEVTVVEKTNFFLDRTDLELVMVNFFTRQPQLGHTILEFSSSRNLSAFTKLRVGLV